jgi:hypothetical protein
MHMNKTALAITFSILFTNTLLGQGYYWISYHYYSYVEISVQYTRSVSRNSFNYGNALAHKQAQYDAAYAEASAVYGQMENLEMLNITNRNYLNNYRNAYFKSIAADAGRLDLSIPQNKHWVIDNFRKPLTSNKHLRNEIKILNKLGSEIEFIEHRAYKFSRDQVGDIEQKKKNIVGFLTEYETADPSSTQALLKKYDLYLMMMGEFLEW